jgi:hypothetical protein
MTGRIGIKSRRPMEDPRADRAPFVRGSSWGSDTLGYRDSRLEALRGA